MWPKAKQSKANQLNCLYGSDTNDSFLINEIRSSDCVQPDNWDLLTRFGGFALHIAPCFLITCEMQPFAGIWPIRNTANMQISNWIRAKPWQMTLCSEMAGFRLKCSLRLPFFIHSVQLNLASKHGWIYFACFHLNDDENKTLNGRLCTHDDAHIYYIFKWHLFLVANFAHCLNECGCKKEINVHKKY